MPGFKSSRIFIRSQAAVCIPGPYLNIQGELPKQLPRELKDEILRQFLLMADTSTLKTRCIPSSIGQLCPNSRYVEDYKEFEAVVHHNIPGATFSGLYFLEVKLPQDPELCDRFGKILMRSRISELNLIHTYDHANFIDVVSSWPEALSRLHTQRIKYDCDQGQGIKHRQNNFDYPWQQPKWGLMLSLCSHLKVFYLKTYQKLCDDDDCDTRKQLETMLFKQWHHQLPVIEKIYIHHSFVIPEVMGDLWWPGPFVQFSYEGQKWRRLVDVIDAEDIDNYDDEEYDSDSEGAVDCDDNHDDEEYDSDSEEAVECDSGEDKD
ncbi:hypothetical protein CPB84DRAFT_1745974 [Gymnopilus junonius]|uniref:Uncharacterized protein n=1 Tax=Gymnopilus junonius TaxID=109634 RepID=A0A9P5NP15_GYMJU|nr:hypothetical protein CPB84DRAFT_1745974 [Gymnopilus junonius]